MRRIHAWRTALLATFALALACPMSLRADDAKKDPSSPNRRSLERQLYRALREVINHGADLYNSGDAAGCYRLYEGALMAARPLLAHRTELRRAIDSGLTRAQRNPNLARRAFDLRDVLDRVRADIRPAPKKAAGTAPARDSLWERLGGEEGVRKVVHDFVAAAAADPAVNFTRGGKYKVDAEKLEQSLVDLIHDVTRPAGDTTTYYKGKSMKEAHKGMSITDAEFNALAKHLIDALKKHNVKEDDIQALVGKVESTRKEKKPEDE